jgi:hypothetical protein
MRYFKTTSLLLITIVLFIFSCKTETTNPSDPRDIYLGEYQTTENISSYGSLECGDPYEYERDTIIVVTKGQTDSTLLVLGREVYLDSTGRTGAYHYSLRLWNDSIYSFFMNGGLGCGQYEVYRGYKISQKK